MVLSTRTQTPFVVDRSDTTRLRRAYRASCDTRVAREYAWNEKNMKVVCRNSVGATTSYDYGRPSIEIDSFVLLRFESAKDSKHRNLIKEFAIQSLERLKLRVNIIKREV